MTIRRRLVETALGRLLAGVCRLFGVDADTVRRIQRPDGRPPDFAGW